MNLFLRKQISQLESDKGYLEKLNRHLEKILEATNAYKKQEVSELNRIHVETLKVSKCVEFFFSKHSLLGCHFFE